MAWLKCNLQLLRLKGAAYKALGTGRFHGLLCAGASSAKGAV